MDVRKRLATRLRILARWVERNPASPPDDTTLGPLVPHVAYEVVALEKALARCPHWVGLEVLLLHTRNLCSFFLTDWCPYAAHASEDVFAEHYFSDPRVWRRARGSSPMLEATRRAIDKQLAHLGKKRAHASKSTKNLEAAAP